MKASIAMLAHLLLGTVLTVGVAKPQPWERVTLEGRMETLEPMQLWGNDDKRLAISFDDEHLYQRMRLGFATRHDYLDAERRLESDVVVTGVCVAHGRETWFLVESVAGKR